MANDITRIFRTLVKAIQSTSSDSLLKSRFKSVTTTNPPDDQFSFAHRAISLRTRLHQLASYIGRFGQLTASRLSHSIANSAEQRLHAELASQIGLLCQQCDALLEQLKQVAASQTVADADGKDRCWQLRDHRVAVIDSLGAELTRLCRLRDKEDERNRRLIQLTGSLAAGLGSLPVNRNLATKSALPVTNNAVDSPSHHLTESEVSQFEMENKLIYDFLSDQQDDVEQIGRSVLEIGRLNQQFTAHVSEQLEITEQINENALSSSAHIEEGNELIRKALSTQASTQFWIIFTLLVLTFSLHFLDWYNP